jgi:UDP-N-acetylmuramyl tripeptide synthase
MSAPWKIMYSSEKPFGAPESDHECALWLSDKGSEPGKLSATLHSNADTDTHDLTIPVSGMFNLNNALCAIGCAHGMNVQLHDAVQALSSFTGVAGRMERIDAGQPFSVFIDFTVTPQSYTATLSTLKAGLAPGKRLLALLGSCGDRMKEKRPIVGGIAANLTDIMIVTNEDPYTEDPEKIIDDVLAGVPKSMPIYKEALPVPAPAKYCLRMSDRGNAIKTIMRLAAPGDVVLLCGKGSDTTMMLKNGQIPWNEREIARDALMRLRETKAAVR